jgi:hypothetical protein
MKHCFLRAILIAGISIAGGAWAQTPAPEATWTPITVRPTGAEQDLTTRLEEFRGFRLDTTAMRRLLATAPPEFVMIPAQSPTIVTIPFPDATMRRFTVVESPILSPELQRRHPNIRTYVGQGVEDRTMRARFDLTVNGFSATVFTTDRVVFVDPVRVGNNRDHVSYYRTPFTEPFRCLVEGKEAADGMAEIMSQRPTGDTLWTYRLAANATGEYTVFFGGVDNARAQMVTSFNRVNGVYETDFTIRLSLVYLNPYPDPNTDPFTRGTVIDGTLLNQNQAALDQNWGNSNYDVGHVLSRGGGGIAFLRATCSGPNKGKGASALNNPRGDAFDIDYLAHELGHQFGGDHTFNGTQGGCGGNRVSTSAYEPGSGSTIMAYAGLCSGDNVQNNSDPYFHTRSYEQFLIWRSGGGNCAVRTATGNTPPTVNAGDDFQIPRGTPFILTAAGSDPDGDALTYCWEQFDLGTGDFGPLFRSRTATVSPSRFLPRLATVLNNVNDRWERLAPVDRALNFRVTIRDNRAGAGGASYDDVRIVVAGDPMVVVSPNGGESWVGGSRQSVTWIVGGGSVSPTVDIFLSTNGGTSFENGQATLVADDVANDGEQEIIVPNVDTNQARIFVVSSNGRFYDVSNGNFSITRGSSETILPTSYQVTRGSEVGSNDVQKIRDGNDGNPAIVRQAFQFAPTIANAELTANLQVPGGNPVTSATLAVRVAGNPLPLSSARREIALFNWSTGQFEVVSTQSPMSGTSFETVTVGLNSGQVGNFINGAGDVRVATRIFQQSPVSPAWTMSVSLVRLEITR